MTDDLDALTETAAAAIQATLAPGADMGDWYTDDLRVAIRAVLPDIRRAVAEEIAEAIGDRTMSAIYDDAYSAEDALWAAARIAREVGSA